MATVHRVYIPKQPAWGTYQVVMDGTLWTDEVYWVLNNKGEKVNVEWATEEGATACAELLALGVLKE